MSEHDEEEAKSLVSSTSTATASITRTKKKGSLFKKKKKKVDDDDEKSIATAITINFDEAESKLKERVWPFGNRAMTLSEKLTIGAGTVGAAASIGAMALIGIGYISASPAAMAVSFVAASAAVVSAPHAIKNQAELAKMDTFREVLNQMRQGVNKFGDENKKLTASVDDLEEHVSKLIEIENGLREIAEKQGMQLDELTELIAENKRINKEMAKVLRASALQRIFALLIECDVDGDYKLSGQELTRFAMGLTQIEDVPMDTEELVTKLRQFDNFDLTTFLQLIQDLIFDEDEYDDEEEMDNEKENAEEKDIEDGDEKSASSEDS